MTPIDVISIALLGGVFGGLAGNIAANLARNGCPVLLCLLIPISTVGIIFAGVLAHTPLAFALLLGYTVVALRAASATPPRPRHHMAMTAHLRGMPLPKPEDAPPDEISTIWCSECGIELWLPLEVVKRATTNGFDVSYECPAHFHLPTMPN